MDKFNHVYVELLKHLKHEYPELDIHLRNYHSKELLNNFIEYNLPHIEEISTKNIDAFKYKYDEAIVKNVNFRKLIKLAEKKGKMELIWRYLQTLYITAHNLGNLEERVAEKFPEKLHIMHDILGNHQGWMENIVMSNNITVESSDSDSSEDEIEGVEEVKSEKKEKKEEGKEGKEDKEKEEEKKEDNKEEKNPLEGTVIGKLAEELANEMPKEDMEEFKDIKSFADIQAKLFNGDGGKKIGKMIELVGKKMETKMKNGEINQQQIMQEASQFLMNGMMGNGGGQNMMQEMMKSMMGNNRGSKKKHNKKRK